MFALSALCIKGRSTDAAYSSSTILSIPFKRKLLPLFDYIFPHKCTQKIAMLIFSIVLLFVEVMKQIFSHVRDNLNADIFALIIQINNNPGEII